MISGLLFNNFFDFIMDIVSLIPKIVYYLSMSLASLMDVIQLAIRKVAGLDAYYIGQSGEPQTGDIAISFIQSIFEKNSRFPALKNAFWSLVILGVVIIVIATIIAVIRNEYSPNENDAKDKTNLPAVNILKRAFKSVAFFVIVPVSVIFGLAFSNILLRALDGATTGSQVGGVLFSKSGVTTLLKGSTPEGGTDISYTNYDFFGFSTPSTTTTFSGMVFKAAAYNSNRVRIGNTYKYSGENKSYYELLELSQISNFGIFNLAETSAEAAQMIDEAFAGNVKLANPDDLMVLNSPARVDVASNLIFVIQEFVPINGFSKYNVALVWYYYDLWQYNFIIAFAFLIVSLKIMIKIIFGLMQRIIEMVALFIISPPIIALMPLDGGKAFKTWRETFMSKTLMSVGAIVGMNLMFMILPYLNELKFVTAANSNEVAATAISIINLLISTLFMVVGLHLIESFVELIGKIIGGENAIKAGEGLIPKVGDTLQQSVNKTALAAGLATAPIGLAGRGVSRATNAIGRSVTGNRNWTAGDAIGRAARRGRALNRGDRAIFEGGERQDWSLNQGAERAYENYLAGHRGLQDDMRERYSQRQDMSQSYDDWRQSGEGEQAYTNSRNALQNNNQLQGFDDFRRAETGAGAQVFNANVRQRQDNFADGVLEARRNHRQLNPNWITRAGRRLAPAFRTRDEHGRYTMLGRTQSFYSSAGFALSEAAERRGKVSFFETITRSFGGASERQIANEQRIAGMLEEERARMAARDRAQGNQPPQNRR